MSSSQKIKEKKEEIEAQMKKGAKKSSPADPVSFNAVAFRASTDMLSSILVGSLMGLAFDRYLLTAHYGLIIGFILGSIAGLLNVYRRLCKIGYGFNRH